MMLSLAVAFFFFNLEASLKEVYCPPQESYLGTSAGCLMRVSQSVSADVCKPPFLACYLSAVVLLFGVLF